MELNTWYFHRSIIGLDKPQGRSSQRKDGLGNKHGSYALDDCCTRVQIWGRNDLREVRSQCQCTSLVVGYIRDPRLELVLINFSKDDMIAHQLHTP